MKELTVKREILQQTIICYVKCEAMSRYYSDLKATEKKQRETFRIPYND